MKPDKDFTKEADRQIPEAEELAKVTLLSLWSHLTLAKALAVRIMFSRLSRSSLYWKSIPGK